MNELAWVDFLKKNVKKRGDIVRGIGDDCAVIKQAKNKYTLFSSDLFIDGVHFNSKKGSYKKFGQRAAARALSDIVACAGIPLYLGVSCGVPKTVPQSKLKSLFLGINEYCSKHKVAVIGGDTARAKNLFLDIWVIGETKKYVLRNTARDGDYIFVTGKLGKLKFDEPFPLKTQQIKKLVKDYKVNSMIDISDGFVIDLYRILKESNKGALLYGRKLPVHKNMGDLFRGEDYELLFTVDKQANIEKLKKKYFLVGQIKRKSFGYKIEFDGKIKTVEVKGYTHF
jgi:thiamine-monophosphate kinase